MEEIEKRVLKAKDSKKETERLLLDYMPFIKKQAAGYVNGGAEYDDLLSIAMLTFVNCIAQYQPGKGSFLEFAKFCIRNRLIDEVRKQKRYLQSVTYKTETEEESEADPDEIKAAFREYSREEERKNLLEEIHLLTDELLKYDITFRELTKICPKQERSRNLCMLLATETAKQEGYRKKLKENRRLPQMELSERMNISRKTIEKHRKYIIALSVILMGDFPAIRTFLPQMGR